MKATRRAMLLALGVDVTDIPVAELDKPTEATVGGDEWSIRTINVFGGGYATIDVTSHGDVEPRYVRLRQRQQRVHLVVDATEASLAARAGKVGQFGMPELQLDDVVGDHRLSARLVVISCTYNLSPVDRMVTATFECEVVGKIAFEPVVPPEPVATGRRGMAL